VLHFRLGSPATVGKEYAHSLEGLNLASVAFGFGEEKKSLFGWVQARLRARVKKETDEFC
jgi:hypothetical protein